MDHTELLADTNFLDRLLEGSFETVIERLEAAVEEHRELFGGSDDVVVGVKGTYPAHLIVMNDQLGFYRVEWAVDDDGEVTFGEVKRVDVPVKETKHLGRESHEHASAVVDAVLEGDDDTAKAHLAELFDLVRRGVKLTAESVEDAIDFFVGSEPPWLAAVRDNAATMRGFVGARSNKDLPKVRFEALIDADPDDIAEEDDARYRKVVAESLRRLRTTLEDMNASIAVAMQIDESYELNVEGGGAMEAGHFIEFVDQFGVDLEALIGLTEDAVAISANGTLKSLARVHDKTAGVMADIGLAAAFAEKFATRFSAPQAA